MVLTHIVFSEVSGHHDVICFHEMCSYLISDKWYADRKADPAEESVRIVRTAGKLIASAVHDLKLCTDQYPTSDDMSGSTADSGHWIPGLLQMFMKELVSSSTKHTAFCQTIVQASRPRTAILLIPLPLTISIDNICGSSELIIESAWLGFCLSYDELLWFKH